MACARQVGGPGTRPAGSREALRRMNSFARASVGGDAPETRTACGRGPLGGGEREDGEGSSTPHLLELEPVIAHCLERLIQRVFLRHHRSTHHAPPGGGGREHLLWGQEWPQSERPGWRPRLARPKERLREECHDDAQDGSVSGSPGLFLGVQGLPHPEGFPPPCSAAVRRALHVLGRPFRAAALSL